MDAANAITSMYFTNFGVFLISVQHHWPPKIPKIKLHRNFVKLQNCTENFVRISSSVLKTYLHQISPGLPQRLILVQDMLFCCYKVQLQSDQGFTCSAKEYLWKMSDREPSVRTKKKESQCQRSCSNAVGWVSRSQRPFFCFGTQGVRILCIATARWCVGHTALSIKHIKPGTEAHCLLNSSLCVTKKKKKSCWTTFSFDHLFAFVLKFLVSNVLSVL